MFKIAWTANAVQVTMSWFECLNLSRIVNCVSKSLNQYIFCVCLCQFYWWQCHQNDENVFTYNFLIGVHIFFIYNFYHFFVFVCVHLVVFVTVLVPLLPKARFPDPLDFGLSGSGNQAYFFHNPHSSFWSIERTHVCTTALQCYEDTKMKIDLVAHWDSYWVTRSRIELSMIAKKKVIDS